MPKPLPAYLVRQFTAYSADHRNPTNQLCHAIGIPCILIGTTAVLPTALGLLLAVAYILWQHLMIDRLTGVRNADGPMSATLAFVFAIGLIVGLNVPAPWLWGLIAFGWAIQFLGHFAFEKKSPAFFSSLSQLLTGPLYYAALVTGKWPPKTGAAPAPAVDSPAPAIDGDDGPADR